MIPRVEVETRTAIRVTKEIARQFPFAVAGALNDTAKDFQSAQRAHQEKVFEIRRTVWFERAVKIKPFASGSKGRRLQVTISYDPPGANNPKSVTQDLFVRHQRGGTRRPTRGASSLAVAQEGVKRTPTGVIRADERPRRLKQRGAFVITLAGGKRGVFRRNTRRGRGRSRFVEPGSAGSRAGRDPNLEFLYLLIPQADIDDVLDFFDRAEETMQKRFVGNWIVNWRKELRKAVAFQNRRLLRRGLPAVPPGF